MKCMFLAASLFIALSIAHADPQSTAFTYQGNLTANGAPANGNFDLTFKLFDALTDGNQIGSSITMAAFPVSNGRFTTDLDFPGAFSGKQRWVEIAVGTEILSPRQSIDSAPVATFALASAPLPSDVGQTLIFSYSVTLPPDPFPTRYRLAVIAPDQTEIDGLPLSGNGGLQTGTITIPNPKFGSYSVVWSAGETLFASQYTVSIFASASRTGATTLFSIPVTQVSNTSIQSGTIFVYSSAF